MAEGGRSVRRGGAILAALLLVTAACDTSRPSPTPEPTQVGQETGGPETPAPSAPASPSPTPTPPEPSSVDLIAAAVAAGEIDEPAGFLFRFYALWGDARLPEQYRGVSGEDRALAATAALAAESYSAADQAMLRPFLVRPTHPDSYWIADPASQPRTTPDGAVGAVMLARLAQATQVPACVPGEWARRDLANIPVTIWTICTGQSGFGFELKLAEAAERIAALLGRIWTPMVGDMGPPVPDRFLGASRGPNEVAEAGDGRLDVYLTFSPDPTRGNRSLDTWYSGAAAFYAAPYDRAKGSAASYIVLDVNRRPNAFDQEATMAHELFHVLQSAHNGPGSVVCPYPSTSSTCADSVKTYHWFTEASAQWAVHEYLPTHRQYVYSTFEQFRISPLALASTDRENEYWSFMWPLFMEQETLRGAGVVADAWTALEGKKGWLDLQAAVDSVLRFETSFRDFAVRVWNEDLPGRPIDPVFQHPNLDSAFPQTTPGDGPAHPRFLGDVRPALGAPDTSTVDIPELWAAYYTLSPPGGAGRLTLDFSAVQPNARLDVDALVKVDDAWERRKLDSGVNDICLDTAGGRIEGMVLVLSNHSQTPEEHVKGDWRAIADAAGCASARDALTYTSMRKVGSPGESYYETIFETISVQVRLKASPDGFGFVDDGSTFRGGVDTTSFIAGLPGANCDTIAEGHGGGGGQIASTDGAISGFYANRVLTVTFSVPITVTSSGQNCLGSTSGETVHWITPPPCDGTEIVGQDLVFDFNCTFQGPDWQWTFSGKVKVAA